MKKISEAVKTFQGLEAAEKNYLMGLWYSGGILASVTFAFGIFCIVKGVKGL